VQKQDSIFEAIHSSSRKDERAVLQLTILFPQNTKLVLRQCWGKRHLFGTALTCASRLLLPATMQRAVSRLRHLMGGLFRAFKKSLRFFEQKGREIVGRQRADPLGCP
jgi:hypothetical protein